MPAADVTFADLTTLGVGGPISTLVEATDEDAVIGALSAADANGEPVIVVGGGSNLLVADEGFAGTVVHVATRGVHVDDDATCGGVMVTIAAGEPWDDVVQRAVASGWVGIECLSGIPGSAGATPLQNVGAYGQDVAQTLARVRVYDRTDRMIRTIAVADCAFGYRSSRFKGQDRFVVLHTVHQFPLGEASAPIAYAELARALGVELGQRAPLLQVRDAVLALRRAKGMVIDANDADTRSAGSFFTNPLLDQASADALPTNAPRWPQPDGRIKTSAAWLIENAGFAKGYGNDRAALSTKHTLALTNRGSASASDLVRLANEIRRGVQQSFGVTLVPEPRLVGVALEELPS